MYSYFWRWAQCLEQIVLEIRVRSQEKCMLSGEEMKKKKINPEQYMGMSSMFSLISSLVIWTLLKNKEKIQHFCSQVVSRNVRHRESQNVSIISLVYSSPLNLIIV